MTVEQARAPLPALDQSYRGEFPGKIDSGLTTTLKTLPEDVSGNLLALASGLCFALFFLLMRHSKARQVNRAASAIYGNLIAVVICAPAFVSAARRGIAPADFARIAYLGVVQIGFAYLLFTLAMARGVRSLDASIIGYVEPVLNPVWVFLFIGERPSGWAIIGGAIIIVSVMAHTVNRTRQKQSRIEVTPHK